MKKFYFILFLFACVGNLFSAPLYRAGETKSPATDFYRWEVGADYIYSFMGLKDRFGSNALRGAQGVGVRALYNLTPYIGVGAEGSHFFGQSFGNFVSKYEQDRAGVLLKLTLSPDVSPRVYGVFGIGKSRHRFVYRKTPATLHWKNGTSSATYLQAGLGAETDIWKNFFIGAEGDFNYHPTTSLNFYYRLKRKWAFSGRLRIGVRF